LRLFRRDEDTAVENFIVSGSFEERKGERETA